MADAWLSLGSLLTFGRMANTDGSQKWTEAGVAVKKWPCWITELSPCFLGQPDPTLALRKAAPVENALSAMGCHTFPFTMKFCPQLAYALLPTFVLHPHLWTSAHTGSLTECSTLLLPVTRVPQGPDPACLLSGASPRAGPSWVISYFRLQGHLSGWEPTVVFARQLRAGLGLLPFQASFARLAHPRTGRAGGPARPRMGVGEP